METKDSIWEVWGFRDQTLYLYSNAFPPRWNELESVNKQTKSIETD